MAATPVAVEVWRGDRVESRHRVRACVADADGAVALALGDVDEPVYPRSAVKPFQALALVESGAADAFGVGEAELALACASHGGEPDQVALVEGWLGRLGLGEDALACGPHAPLFAPAAAALLRAGQAPRRVHNNCSGKHTGMLAAALHLGQPTAGYERAGHAVQRHCAGAVAALAGLDRLAEPGIDGCGLPNHPLPLRALARAAAALADPGRLEPARRAALARVAAAMRAQPRMVAGTGRCCTALMERAPVIAKTGAEGAYIAAVPALGLGVALKAEDGATRAAEVALLALLDHLGALDGPGTRDGLERFRAPRLRNFAGAEVGRVAAASGWPAR